MTIKRDANGRITKGSSPINKSGNNGQSGAVSRFNEAIKADMPEVIEQTISLALDGDVSCIKLLLDRTTPTIKPQGITIELEEMSVEGITEAVGNGLLDTSTASQLMQLLLNKQTYQSNESLENRLQALEDQINESHT